jgi:hypothetical protein
MNKNKLVAILIAVVVMAGPFYQLFVANGGSTIVHSAREIFLMLAWIIGMIIAFGIAVNEPFSQKQTAASSSVKTQEKRKAA